MKVGHRSIQWMMQFVLLGGTGLLLNGGVGVAADEAQLVIGWGDSLTEGYCTDGYQTSLVDQMAAEGRSAQMVNCGYGGETSADSLNRLRRTLAGTSQEYEWELCSGHLWSRQGWYSGYNGQRADFILLWLGANDVIAGVQASTTLYNLQQLVTLSRAYSLTPLLATLTPDEKYDMDNCTVGTLGGINEGIRALASSLNVPLADQCQSISTWGVKDCGDGLHPNEIGDEKIAWTWSGVLPKDSDYPDPVEESSVIMAPLYLLLDQ
jgi:lysophospholipase L1-like esterase